VSYLPIVRSMRLYAGDYDIFTARCT